MFGPDVVEVDAVTGDILIVMTFIPLVAFVEMNEPSTVVDLY